MSDKSAPDPLERVNETNSSSSNTVDSEVGGDRTNKPQLNQPQYPQRSFEKRQPSYRRRTSSEYHPRRLLRSISHVFTPHGTNNEGSNSNISLGPERRRRYGVWYPVHYLMSSVQARLRQKPLQATFSERQLPQHPRFGERNGRFYIGHPSSCNDNIDDSNEPSITGRNGSLASAPQWMGNRDSESNNMDLYGTWTNRVNSRRTSITFMDNDLIRCLCIIPPEQAVIVRINVSGVRFNVMSCTLQRDPYVYSKFIEDAIWLPVEREYFVERDPEVFRFIHNYLRHGEVHLPLGICGPLLEKELDDWGLPLGLDIQRCCLGPVMNTKFKLESLKKFERKLQPKYIKPNAWIKSIKWQVIRAKVWSALEITPKLSFQSKTSSSASVNSSNGTDDCTFFKEEKVISHLDENDIKRATGRPTSETGDKSAVSFARVPQASLRSNMDLLPKEDGWVRWFRRTYIVCEALTVIAAVLVFMLSTCKEFRVPLVSKSYPTNTSTTLPLQGKFSLPIPPLISMNIAFTVIITIDLLMRMVFCPAIRPWLFSLQTLIDLMSVIPFYCEFILREMIRDEVSMDQDRWLGTLIKTKEYLGVLKVFVVLRLFRIVRRHRSSIVLLYTIRTTLVDLSIIMGLILGFALFFGALMYFIDENFNDIPRGFWWALITMSTVGYGDLVPSKTFGYGIATVCVLTGTLLMSYTIPILVNTFLLYYEHAEQLHMIKQLHFTAKNKAGRRTLSKYAQKALAGAKGLVNATWTKSAPKVIVVQSSRPKVAEVKVTDENEQRKTD